MDAPQSVRGLRTDWPLSRIHPLHGSCDGVGSSVRLRSSRGSRRWLPLATAVALPFIVPQILLMVHKAKEADQYLRFLESGLSEREAAQGVTVP